MFPRRKKEITFVCQQLTRKDLVDLKCQVLKFSEITGDLMCHDQIKTLFKSDNLIIMQCIFHILACLLAALILQLLFSYTHK